MLRQATIDPNATLADTDPENESFCAQINARAYEWALNHAPPATRSRFESLGTPLVFDEDIR